MSEENTVEKESPVQERVLLLPSHAFYVERLELPKGLEEKELPDYAQINLETLAPFPLEQLNWGFLKETHGEAILLYATHRERLIQLGFENVEDYLWVLPDFAPLVFADFPKNTDVLLENPGSVTRLHLPGEQRVPDSVTARSEAALLPPAPGSSSAVVVRTLETKVSDQSRAVFCFECSKEAEREEAEEWTEIHMPEAALWQADVRAPDFKSAERNRRQLSSLIMRTTTYVGFAAVALVLLEFCLLIGNSWIGTRASKIADQSPEVRRIEDKQSLMNKLDQVAQSELRPIAILEALNRSRPEGIYFTSAVTEGRNRTTVDGIANTIREFNAYTDSLEDSGRFQLVGNPQQITRSGKTTFTVTLDYITVRTIPEDEADG